MKYCLPITYSDKLQISKELSANHSSYAAFEIWLDYIEKPDSDFVKKLVNEYHEKLIFLFRRLNLEKTTLDADFKKELLHYFAKSKSYVDLDIFDQKQELQHTYDNKLNLNLICSYHNYTETPLQEDLLKIIDSMKAYSPAIFKIACYCKNENDAVALLNILLKLKSENKKYIVLGMGKHGLATRVFSSLWGNELIFTPSTILQSTAPGQLTKDTYEKIFNLLK